MGHETGKSTKKRAMSVIATLATVTLTAAACSDDSSSAGGGEGGECYPPGDRVELMVPFGEGGGTDTTARLVAPYLSELMDVDIQVVNVPGGGSVLGANRYVNQTEADGKTLLMTSASTQVPVIVRQQGVEFSFDDLTPIAGFPLGGIIYSQTDNDVIKEATDLADSEEFTYAGQPATGGELRILLIFEMLEANVNAVLGYDGRGPARVAWEQNESDLGYDTAPAYLASVEPMVDAGDAQALMSFGAVEGGELVRDPEFPDLPSPVEVYEEVNGEPPSGAAYDAYVTMAVATISLNKALTIHADAPQNCKDALADAWDELSQDDEFISEAENELGGYEILLRENAEEAWNSLGEVEPASIDWLLQWVEDTYDVRLKEASQD